MNLGCIFASIVGKEFGLMLRIKEPHKPSQTFSQDILRPDCVQFCWLHKNSSAAFFPFLSKKAGDIITTGQHMNYQTASNL